MKWKILVIIVVMVLAMSLSEAAQANGCDVLEFLGPGTTVIHKIAEFLCFVRYVEPRPWELGDTPGGRFL